MCGKAATVVCMRRFCFALFTGALSLSLSLCTRACVCECVHTSVWVWCVWCLCAFILDRCMKWWGGLMNTQHIAYESYLRFSECVSSLIRLLSCVPLSLSLSLCLLCQCVSISIRITLLSLILNDPL